MKRTTKALLTIPLSVGFGYAAARLAIGLAVEVGKALDLDFDDGRSDFVWLSCSGDDEPEDS